MGKTAQNDMGKTGQNDMGKTAHMTGEGRGDTWMKCWSGWARGEPRAEM